MFKQYKFQIILSSIVILLPALFGFITGAKSIIAIPFVLLAFHLLCLFITSKDAKSANQNKKAFSMVLWIIPSLSVWICSMMYALIHVEDFDPTNYTLFIISLMFILFGNYMPKIKQNSTLGIKIKWTLLSEDNWFATHRFAGKVWVVCGVAIAICAFLPYKALPYVVVPVIFISGLVPMLYSYLIYRKQKSNGTLGTSNTSNIIAPYFPKGAKIVSMVLLIIVLAGVAVLMFTGNIKAHYSEDAVTFESTYWDDINIKYSDITAIEYQETNDDGARIYGFGSARLQLGKYKNDEYGNYTRCCYTNCDATVIIKTENEIYVVNRLDAATTKDIYNEILARINK